MVGFVNEVVILFFNTSSWTTCIENLDLYTRFPVEKDEWTSLIYCVILWCECMQCGCLVNNGLVALREFIEGAGGRPVTICLL